jgi:hypothetical protein
MTHYVCSLKARPVFPYIALAQANSKTAAARLFLDHIKNMQHARKSTGSVLVNEVTEKFVSSSMIRSLT